MHRLHKESKPVKDATPKNSSKSRVDELYKWNQNKQKKIKKLRRDASKHMFKPDINPVSKIIVEREKESMFNQSESSEGIVNQKMLNISVHEKLYLSRNSSHGLLPENPKT